MGGQTSFTYDPNGNLLTLTDARGKTTTWTYDTMDRIATRTDPLLRAESFTYNENGAIETWTDRKGQVTEYAYDAVDRQTFIGFGRTGTPPTYPTPITTTCDAGDRATAVVDSTAGTTARTYDALDRLIEEVTPEGTVTYAYDAASRRRMTDNGFSGSLPHANAYKADPNPSTGDTPPGTGPAPGGGAAATYESRLARGSRRRLRAHLDDDGVLQIPAGLEIWRVGADPA